MNTKDLAKSVLFGLGTRILMDFYIRYKELDDFGRLPYAEAVKRVTGPLGTVAQHERLNRISLDRLHIMSDSQQLQAQPGVQYIDPSDPEQADIVRQLLARAQKTGESKEPPGTGHYL